MKNSIKQYLLAAIMTLVVLTGSYSEFSASEVSKSEIGATIGDTFPDDTLATCVATSLRKTVTDPVTQTELDGITDLTCSGVADIEGIDLLTNINDLELTEGNIDNIDLLAGLTNLTKVDVNNNKISDISALSGLTNLTSLSMRNNEVSDISVLSGLTNLGYFHGSNNQISDISVLSGLTNLTILELGNNQISDISALSGLTKLTQIDLRNNEISDISALSWLVNADNVFLDGNQISDISALSGLTNVTILSLDNNQISDISPVSGITILDYISVLNQTIDLGTLPMSTKKIPAPLSANINYNYLGYNPPITGIIDYSFANGETVDGDEINLNSNVGTPIDFVDGTFSGTINFTRSNEPVITLPSDITITEGDLLDILVDVTATDVEDGDLTSAIVVENPDAFKGDGTDSVGTYEITYTVMDSDGFIASSTRTITVTAKEVVDPTDNGGTDTDLDSNDNNNSNTDSNDNEDSNESSNENANYIAVTGLNNNEGVILTALSIVAGAITAKYVLNRKINI